MPPDHVRLRFRAQPGRTYSILRAQGAGPGQWSVLADFASALADSWQETVVGATTQNPMAWYRLVTPQPEAGPAGPDLWLQPAAGATAAAASTCPEVACDEPFDPATVSTNTIGLVDDLGRPVAGRAQLAADARTMMFVPDLPLTHATDFTVRLKPGVRTLSGRALPESVAWRFSTAPAPDLVEDQAVYESDDTRLIELEISLLPKIGGWTWADVYADNNPNNTNHPHLKIRFVERGLTNLVYAGEIRQRGQSVRESAQKSYRIDLAKSGPAWHGFRTLDLNKHPYDLTRVRNKLAFDLLRQVPHMTSLRTRFVHLTIDGQDYGLFTQVENADPDALAAHRLDSRGHLYKATFFEFERYPDALRLATDPLCDRRRFQAFLEIKGDGDHAKLLRMLDDLNQADMPIDRVLAKHFCRENYLSWLAANILLGNKDTASQNFLLYSPHDASAWYLLPWDYDGALGFYDQPDQAAQPFLARWQAGLANWWGGVLHNRFLREPGNVAELDARVADLSGRILRRENVEALLARYRPVVAPLALREPDLYQLPILEGDPATAFAKEFDRLADVIDAARAEYRDTFSRPMPFYLGAPERLDGGWSFGWDTSFSLNSEEIRYDFQLNRSPGFDRAGMVAERIALRDPTLALSQVLEPGVYFWRVLARGVSAPETDWQAPFDFFNDPLTGRLVGGVARLVVE